MTRKPNSIDQSGSKEVNSLLHTLRGEQFRHSQNVRRSRSHLSLALASHNTPTLPTGLTEPELRSGEEGDPLSALKCSGPGPSSEADNTSTWRAQALSIVLRHLHPNPLPLDSHSISSQSHVPPLTLICLRILVLAFSTKEFTEAIVPSIPPHLRCDLVRYSAVHSPLSNSKLYALCGPDGHIDGELIIVGPSASLQDNHFRKTSPGSAEGHARGTVEADNTDNSTVGWDSDEWSAPALRTVVLLSTRLPISDLLSLPPTITCLGLINLPAPISLHRLPNICPLLVVLDLSYNNWLGSPKEASRVLEGVDWNRWNQLQTLGLRGCQIASDILRKVNNGRWDDVNIIQ